MEYGYVMVVKEFGGEAEGGGRWKIPDQIQPISVSPTEAKKEIQINFKKSKKFCNKNIQKCQLLQQHYTFCWQIMLKRKVLIFCILKWT